MAPMDPISYTYIPNNSSLKDQILEKCSKLFSNNYGIWSDDAPHHNNTLQAGSSVRLGIKGLREKMLFNESCFLVIAEILSSCNDRRELIGHAFCSSAKYDRLKGNLVWITQLVVSSSYRGHGVAGNLLSTAKNSIEDVAVVGLASSHPYAVKALSNACNRIPIDLEFIGDHAQDIIRASNVPYISHAQLVGSLFNKQLLLADDSHRPPISLIKTDFFVDHNEVSTILNDLKEKWILGPLLEGHEFFVILPTTSVKSSRRKNQADKFSDCFDLGHELS